MGVGIGLSKSVNQLKTNFSNNLGSDSNSVNMGALWPFESVLLGVAKRYETHFFIAGEVYGSIHQLKKSKKQIVFYRNRLLNQEIGRLDFELEQKYSNGMSFLIGKDIWKDIDVFFKAGLFFGKFLLKYINNATIKQGQEGKWLFGYAPGVGLQAKLLNNLSVRFDYSYKIFNEFKSKNLSREINPTTQIIGVLSPRVHQFMVSLIYTL